jgi:hypothetical protein
MRIRSDIRKAVVFLGHMVGKNFEAAGTGFFLFHDSAPYLVTARHIAEQFDDDPFYLRLNHADGQAVNCYCDPLALAEHHMQWFYSDDPNIDIAAMPMAIDLEKVGADFVVLSTAESIGYGDAPAVDTGDICSVVGLFSLHPGKGRNMPVIHTGNIAMMPDPEEPIPTNNWRGKGTVDIEGYLVEISNLQGLSGSPVMIRPTVALQWTRDGELVGGMIGSQRVYLLGVWQGSWEGTSAIGGVGQKRVPVGMGIVTPVEKLIEVLNAPPCVANRDEFWKGSFRSVVDS